MGWIVETLNEVVDEEIASLPNDMKVRFVHVVQLIESVGLENVREPHIKHIEQKLWEIRVKGKDGISRALYITAHKKRVIVLRAFIKKTQKTPRKEIKLALARAKEVKHDQNH